MAPLGTDLKGDPKVGKFQITANPQNCTGCLRCQLACSEQHTKAFNPSAARIQVNVSGVDCIIHFTNECNECAICVDNCFYDALQKKPKENMR